MLVGRLTSKPEMVNTDSGKAYTKICLAVPRNYKNEEGSYDTDFLYCILWGSVAEAATEYCNKEDLIGVKGRVQSNTYEVDGEKKYSMDIVAEKVTYLSSKKDNG